VAKLSGVVAARIYEASGRFVDQALARDGAMFTPEGSIWTDTAVLDLYERFVGRPDTSSDNFETKFLRQLDGAPSATVQLAAEILYVHLLITTQLRGQTKRDLITKVLQVSPTPVVIPPAFATTLDGGLCNAGQSFLRHRHYLLTFLVEMVKVWKTLGDVSRLLKDPWAFKHFVFSVPARAARVQQHALLHLVHPDTFEPIVSEPHKEMIAEQFRGLVTDPAADVDRQLLEIRQRLRPQFGQDFSFYQEAIKSEWLPRTAEEGSGETVVSGSAPQSQRVWVEKCLVAGRPDRERGPHALGLALWAPQLTEDGRKYYKTIREVQPGDLVLHFVDNRRFAGVSRAATVPNDDFIGLPGTTWEGRPSVRVGLTDYVELQPPIEREELFQNLEIRRRMQEIYSSHRGLFFNRNLELNQGGYLTAAPAPLVRLVNELYQAHAGRSLPYLDLPAAEPPTSPTLPGAALSLSWLADQTLWTPERLQEVIDALQTRTPQVVLAGPPGTGKTWVAQLLAQYLTQGQSKRQRLVQLHPSYSYEAFMEGLRPVVENGFVQFKCVDGVVPAFVKEIGNSDVPHVLVLDEMNRANLPKVLGELMYLFEYRNQPIDLPFTKAFRLPPNLWFIGTMNTADRSIRAIDIALRRRFDVFECGPDYDALERFYETRENHVDSLVDGLKELNQELTVALDRHHTIGHTFFMRRVMTTEELLNVWRHKIGPLLEEYFFDQPDEVAKMDPARFWPELRDEA
jgi:5-methylcytosine-specific restriction enzyme B